MFKILGAKGNIMPLNRQANRACLTLNKFFGIILQQHLNHYLINRQCNTFGGELIPADKAECFRFAGSVIYFQLVAVEIKNRSAYGAAYWFKRFGKIIYGNDLVRGIEGAYLKKIRSI